MLIVESQEESEEQLPGDILEEDEKDLPLLELENTPGLTSPHFDCFFGEGFLGETFFGVSLFFLVSGEGGKGVLNSSVLRLKSEGLKGVSFSKKESGLTMGVLGTSKNEREWSRSSLVGLVNEVSKKLIVELLELCDVEMLISLCFGFVCLSVTQHRLVLIVRWLTCECQYSSQIALIKVVLQ